MATSQTASMSKHWAGWTGPIDRIQRLCESMEELVDGFLTREQQELSEEQARELAYINSLYPEARDESYLSDRVADATRRHQGAVARLRRSWQIEMVSEERGMTRTISGTAAEICAQLDASFVENLSLTIVKSGILIRVSFRRTAISLSATGPNAAWVRQTMSVLGEEIERGVPRFAKIQGRGMDALILLSSFAGVFLIAAGFWGDNPKVIASPWFGLDCGIVAGIIGIGLASAKDKYYPAFQILENGNRSKISQLYIGLAITVFNVGVGIGVNLATGGEWLG